MNIKKERLKEILNNILDWGVDHDDEFMECLVSAADLTLEEAEELEVAEYHEDYEEDEDDEEDYYDSTYDNEEVALLKQIAQSLDMPYEANEDDYDEWNYLSLLHDYNNGRGEEWVDTFEEQGLDSELLDQYKKLVNYDEEEDD